MRRIAIALTLSAGCFSESGPVVDRTDTVAAPMTSAEESSSSAASESSSEESTGEPQVCPEWCLPLADGSSGCEDVDGELLCRCTGDARCVNSHCDNTPEMFQGHCR